MAHNLNIENGRAACFSLRETPWHKLGQIVEAPVTDTEALKLAGLDWAVEKMPLYRKDAEGISSHVAIVRTDNQRTLGVVTKHFHPVQNQELFDWLRGLDGFCDVIIETAGALGNGETVWVQARCNGLSFSIGGDEHKGYMLLANGHAGNRALQVMPTMQRVICMNTLTMAAGGGTTDAKTGKEFNGSLSAGFTLRHTKSITEMMGDIQIAYAKTTQAWKNTEEVCKHLASKPMSDEAIARLFSEPFETPKRENKDQEALQALINDEEAKDEADSEGARAIAIRQAREKRLNEILASATCRHYEATRGTLYAAFNALTEFVDHEGAVRTGTGTTEAQEMARFASAQFGGNGEKIKRRGYKLALELAGA
jgi:phage/plasmid-like protein (TIGR03299 family)